MIGIISAMDIEMKTLVHLLKDKKKKVHAGLDYYTGKLDGVDVVICRCGVGKVNAAMHTQILIDKYKPKALIQSSYITTCRNLLSRISIPLSLYTIQTKSSLRRPRKWPVMKAAYTSDVSQPAIPSYPLPKKRTLFIRKPRLSA